MSDDTYDSTGEVWPYFVVTILGCVLLPATFSFLKSLISKPERTAASFRAKRENKVLNVKTILVVLGWLFMALLVHIIRNSNAETGNTAVWDPYEILGVSHSATVREIRSAYRKLSLVMHPDKVKDVDGDSENSAYVEVVKAYRALTDEVTRENFQLYGHPDGPQPVSHGIALPSFLFNTQASVFIIALYALGFGVGIPLIVNKWWKHSQRRTKNGLLKQTAAKLVEFTIKTRPQFVTKQDILDLVLESPDLEHLNMSLETKNKLLADHFEQKPATDDVLELVAEINRVLVAYIDLAASAQLYALCEKLVVLNRNLMNASYSAKHAISNEIKTSDLPKNFRFVSAQFKVANERTIPTGSKVFLELKYATKDYVPEDEKLVDTELSEFAATKDVLDYNKTQPKLPTVELPHFPIPAQQKWLVFLYNEMDGRLVERPTEIRNMDLSKNIGCVTVPVAMPAPAQPGTFSMKVSALNPYFFNFDFKTRATMDVVAPKPRQPIADEDDELNDEESADESDEEVEGLSDLDTSSEEES